MSWTDERCDMLRTLYAEGLSAGQVGFELGVTRNAVIGKVNRLGLTRASHPSSSPRKFHPKHRPVRTEKFKPHVRLAEPPPEPQPMVEISDDDIPIEQRRTLLQLEARHCRWPCGRPGTPDFFFCGSPTADFPSVPYCPAHAARAFAGRGRAYDRYPAWGRGRA